MNTRAPRKSPELLNRGSLITYMEDGKQRCPGYLFEFPGHGVFEPTFGKVDVSSAEAVAHNQCLSRGEIEGLDQNCAVGMCGRFYLRTEKNEIHVATWTGQEVSRDVRIQGKQISFTRNGRHFRGRLRKDEDCFQFSRIR